MQRFFSLCLLCISIPSTIALAEENPVSAYDRTMHRGVSALLLRSAELMPEESYKFKPTDGVRTFGQIVGHVADAQYLFCSIALEEKNPAPKIEQNKTSKADLIAALKDAVAYCDKAYDSMNDVSALHAVKLFGKDTPRFAVLLTNNVHAVEHYGNLVTYLRMNKIVPPTSDPAFMQQLMK